MPEEYKPVETGSKYWVGLLVGLAVGGGLFWTTMKILVVMR